MKEIKKNQLIKCEDIIYRVLDTSENDLLLIDIYKRQMPKWYCFSELENFYSVPEEKEETVLTPKERAVCQKRYNIISSLLPFIGTIQVRTELIKICSKQNNISEQTVRTYLCNYLATNQISGLLPEKRKSRELTQDEKNMRASLNKWYYSPKQKTLKNCYLLMLQHYYTDSSGCLNEKYPSIHQYRYYFKKYNQKNKEIISREGLSEFMKNYKPLLGDGTINFSDSRPGTFLLDSTIADIYLVDDKGNVIKRPTIVLSVDSYTSCITGVYVGFESGITGVINMVLNIVEDKVEYCKQYGILIEENEWPCRELPCRFVTDKGTEYTGTNFENLTSLGIEILNLKSWSPNEKGSVETVFHALNSYYMNNFSGFGFLNLSFQRRGMPDYRLESCLTLEEFRRAIIRCIVYYNSGRIIPEFRMTDEMLEARIIPTAANIWNYSKENIGANLITVDKRELILTLLPRTEGTITRRGLRVNGMFYHNSNYYTEYLDNVNKKVRVSYNPDSANEIFLIEEDGTYTKFDLLESRYKDKSIDKVQEMKKQQKAIVKEAEEFQLQKELELNQNLNLIAENAKHLRYKKKKASSLKNMREKTQREISKTHKDLGKELRDDK